jgi:hypothetical protein
MSGQDNLNPQQFDPARGKQFARLTTQGKMYYVDRRFGDGQDGKSVDHATAFEDARYSYGLTGRSGKS